MPRKKQPTLLDRAVAKVLTNLNVNTILLALIAGYFGIKNDTMSTKQDEAIAQISKVDSTGNRTALWQSKRDSVNKILFAKLDSILIQTK
jgi:hypothetical protein